MMFFVFFFQEKHCSGSGSILLPPPTSHELQYMSVTSGFTRLSMKTKYVCRGLINPYVIFRLFFLFRPTSRQFQLINSVTSGITALSRNTKYVCRGLIGLYVNFHNNRTMSSTNLHVKICRWGERKKSQFLIFQYNRTMSTNLRLFFLLPPPPCKFLYLKLLFTLSDCLEN